MKIANENGIVTFIMKAGKDLVKSTMSLSEADKIIKKGKITESTEIDGYNLSVDDKYFFAVEKDPNKKKKSVEKEASDNG